MILRWYEKKNIFSIFRTKFLDFGSFWRPHRTSNGYVLLVVVSRHVDKQLYQAIWSLRYWFGCSDGPKLRYLAKNVIFWFWAVFGRGPYVQLYEFEFLTYPKPHSLLYSSYFQLHGPNDYPGAPIPKLQNDVFNIIKSKKSSNLTKWARIKFRVIFWILKSCSFFAAGLIFALLHSFMV